MSTCISQHGEYGQHIVDANYTCERCGVLDDDALIAELVKLRAERDEAKARYENLRNERILSIIFGHHPGAPKPFALYRKNADRVAMAVGAEFPDNAVAVRLNHQGGWFTYSEGGAQRVADADDLRLVWLSDELEPLAQMEQERDAARAELAAADRRGYERAIEALRAKIEASGSPLCDCEPEESPPTSPKTGERMPHHCECRAVLTAAVLIGAYTATEHARQCDHEGARWDEAYGPAVASSLVKGDSDGG